MEERSRISIPVTFGAKLRCLLHQTRFRTDKKEKKNKSLVSIGRHGVYRDEPLFCQACRSIAYPPRQARSCLLERVCYWLRFHRSKMPPCIVPSQLSLHPPNTKRFLVCCDPFGLRMAKILSVQSSRSSRAGKFNTVAVHLGRMAQLAMEWVRKWLNFWQNRPSSLMRAVLTGIAKGAMSILEKTIKLLREEEELGRDGSKTEMRNLEAGHLGYLFLNSLETYPQEDAESFIEDGHFEQGLEQLLTTSSSAKMDKMHLEEDGISKLYLITPSISCDFGNDWEGSSEDNTGLEDTESLGNFPQKWLEHCYRTQIWTKGLNVGNYFGKNLKDCSNHCGELKDFEGSFRKGLESTSASQENEEDLESNRGLAMCDRRNFESPSDCPKDGELLQTHKKGGDKVTLNSETTTLSNGFKSPLVLSLFYSPSEEDEDDDSEDDDSEDWGSEDEMQESSQSSEYLDGQDSGNGDNYLEAKVNSLHQEVLENLCGSLFLNNDPFHPLCLSKPIQAHKTTTSTPYEPKEFTVSFYSTSLDSKPEELYNLPKQPLPKRDPRVTPRQPAHKCCWPDSKKSCDPVTTETSSVSQEANRVIKNVRFSPEVTVHPLVVWDYASRAARRGPWEEMARDRCRFRRRVAEVGAILEHCLGTEHRAKVWRKIYGIPNSIQEEDNANNTLLLSRSSRAERLHLQSKE
ncbi:protein phosphatase 1 regulatory subunit 15A isoform X2 [Rhineura floridana]|uniref:protein phosphatase 1 regulatory subunit 15A isoform X2 n=1 Tax=Rhineura floridana TaxID=261503 RepID=UPI002AC7F447|nr:protein phosphatase 1 regulatory subunit 15A isoform X2 [Rhineura floridana]